ncbi:metallophosphoesterase family protein [Jatrophihabitans sp. DSM 45814]
MRFGLISDVHCNAIAFDRALAELKPDVDEILLLGDLIYEYKFSNAVIDRAREEGLRSVLGNHELGFLKYGTSKPRPDASETNIAYLRSMPMRLDIVADGKKICMVHASPFAPFNEYLYAGSTILERCSELDADILLLGHTHVPMAERYHRTLVVNPGSLGESRDPTSRLVSYAILDTATETVELRRFPDPAHDPDAATSSSNLNPADGEP